VVAREFTRYQKSFKLLDWDSTAKHALSQTWCPATSVKVSRIGKKIKEEANGRIKEVRRNIVKKCGEQAEK
jgi:hypothetical protein